MTKQETQTFVDDILTKLVVTHEIDTWIARERIAEMIERERDTLQARVKELIARMDRMELSLINIKEIHSDNPYVQQQCDLALYTTQQPTKG